MSPDPVSLPAPRLGPLLRRARGDAKASRRLAARLARIDPKALALYEEGRAPAPVDVIERLCKVYGTDVGDFLAPREATVRLSEGSLAVGEHSRPLGIDPSNDEVLGAYLLTLFELRNAKRGDQLSLRDDDLDAIADALGRTPTEIEQRLIELMGVSRDDAVAMRKLLLQRRVLVPAAGIALGLSAMTGVAPTLHPGHAGSGAPAHAEAHAHPTAAAPSSRATGPAGGVVVTGIPAAMAAGVASTGTPSAALAHATVTVPTAEATAPTVAPSPTPAAVSTPPAPAASVVDAPVEAPAPPDVTTPGAPDVTAPTPDVTTPGAPDVTAPTPDVTAPEPDATPPAPEAAASVPTPEPDVTTPAPVVDDATPAREADTTAPVVDDATPAPEADTPAPVVDDSIPPPAPEVDDTTPAPDTEVSTPASDVDPSTPATESDVAPPAEDPSSVAQLLTTASDRAPECQVVRGERSDLRRDERGELFLAGRGERRVLSPVRMGDRSIVAMRARLHAGPGFGLLVDSRLDARQRLTALSFQVDPGFSHRGGFVLRQFVGDRELQPLAHRSFDRHFDPYAEHQIVLSLFGGGLTAHVDGIQLLGIQSLQTLQQANQQVLRLSDDSGGQTLQQSDDGGGGQVLQTSDDASGLSVAQNRLSTGSRVNQARDDAAGLAVTQSRLSTGLRVNEARDDGNGCVGVRTWGESQVGVQTLSIANQAPQSVLSLLR